MLSGVTFHWEARTLFFSAAPPEYDIDLGVPVISNPRHRLYEVNVTLTFEGKSENFTYKEFASEKAQ